MDLKSSNDEDLPSDLVQVSVAMTSFFKFSSLMDQLQGKESIMKHVLVATKLGHLLELSDGKILRSTKLPWKNIKKILVHHIFNPRVLYVVLLTTDNLATLLSYSKLKVIREWQNITKIASEDPNEIGVPQLFLHGLDDGQTQVSNVELLSFGENEENEEKGESEQGKAEAAAALGLRLKAGFEHASRLEWDKCTKENFITQKLQELSLELQGTQETDSLSNELRKQEVKHSSTLGLKIASIKHKIVHDKWVIGVNITNESDRQLICNPELTLTIQEGGQILSYTTKAIKTIQRRVPTDSQVKDVEMGQVKVSIENLKPAILKPKKRACILGICSLPMFSEGPTVSCNGLITYFCKPLSPADDVSSHNSVAVKPPQFYHVPFSAPQLSALEIHDLTVTIDQSQVKGGLSFSCVALYAASYQQNITVATVISPLNDFIQRIDKKYKIVKVCGVSDMYCFVSSESHPLKHAAIILQVSTAHHVNLMLLARDEQQAMLVVHSILDVLPWDSSIIPAFESESRSKSNSTTISNASLCSSNGSQEDIRLKLLAKMKEVVNCIIETFQQTGDKKNIELDSPYFSSDDHVAKKRKLSASIDKKGLSRKGSVEDNLMDEYRKERDAVISRSGDITFESKIYNLFRDRLHELHCQMDDLYIELLK
ncbi:unnamed protein product [Meganyctiphanes norvegica]|uniref:Uncharacterized protein n=1 Tax=Meganyctiphanes norvegica TaxID=48144 RepID=A0AAV2QJ12_MEGNR